MNPVLVLAHNNLELTKKCVESLRRQDDTVSWSQLEKIPCLTLLKNTGFSYGINIGLQWVFELTGADYCLVPNNDTVLPSYAYRELLAYDLPWVSGRETSALSDLDLPFEQAELGGGPQFSCFLIRKDALEKIGNFDESMFSWASDIDFHARAHRLGINLQSSPVTYYHERSSTINSAPPRERREMQMQAEADRLTFFHKWNVPVGPDLQNLFVPELFGIDAQK